MKVFFIEGLFREILKQTKNSLEKREKKIGWVCPEKLSSLQLLKDFSKFLPLKHLIWYNFWKFQYVYFSKWINNLHLNLFGPNKFRSEKKDLNIIQYFILKSGHLIVAKSEFQVEILEINSLTTVYLRN